jgi:glycosyltransferase involved in cell wall biosynthesis
MTVVWGNAWATAAAYAERAGLPLHLIVHDDSPNAEGWGPMEQRVIHARLSHWYPKAASRLCVSPYTADEYRRRYKAIGDVLYPSRAIDSPVFLEPPDTLGQRCQPFTVAFAGTIYPLYAEGLRRIAAALRTICAGRLLVYGPTPSESVRSLLHEPNIELRGRLSAADLIQQCRQEAHAMFVPMTYVDEHRPNVEIAFPSKLADCTAIGLPLVIDGPEYCTAVRWARDNPGVAEVTTEGNIDGLAACLRKLQDPAHRIRLAREAITRGKEYFAPDRAIRILYSKLRSDLAQPENSHSV